MVKFHRMTCTQVLQEEKGECPFESAGNWENSNFPKGRFS